MDERRESAGIKQTYEEQFGCKVPGSELYPPPATVSYDIRQLHEIIDLAPKPRGGIYFVDAGGVFATTRSLDDSTPAEVMTPCRRGRATTRGGRITVNHEWGADKPEIRARARWRKQQNGYINNPGSRRRGG